MILIYPFKLCSLKPLSSRVFIMHVPFSYLLLLFLPCLSTFALLLSIDAFDVLSLNTFCHFDGLLKFRMSFAEKKQNAKEEIVNYFISTAFNKLLRRLSCFMVLRPLARWSSPLKMVTNMWTKVILHETSIKIDESTRPWSYLRSRLKTDAQNFWSRVREILRRLS